MAEELASLRSAGSQPAPALSSLGRLVDINTRCGYDPRTGVMTAPDQVKRAGQRWGVTRAYACSLKAVLFDSGEGNQETLELCARDDFFRPVAVACPTGPYSPDQAEKTRAQGFAMIRLFPEVHGYGVDSAACARLIEAHAEAGVPVMLPVTVGETGRLVHLLGGRQGTFILTGNTYHTMGEILALADVLPSVCLELSGVFTPDGLAVLAESFSAQRMLWGSGYPMLNVGPSVMVLRASGLPPAEIELVASGNADRLLKAGKP